MHYDAVCKSQFEASHESLSAVIGQYTYAIFEVCTFGLPEICVFESLTSFQTYFQVLCHFQSLFRKVEIVLQGGHGELSQ